ncbi:MAG: Carnitine transport permease protein OpuCB [Chlamydiae bacterium]|nr:Carnitine transport permease protein OpuCB [Chlamydiota bacterium]
MIPIIIEKTLQHLFICFSALFFALCIALPLGFRLSRSKNTKFASTVIRIFSLIQTIPGLAMIAIIVVVLVALRSLFPIPTTGYLPGILVLFLYAIPPILTNTYTAIRQTSPAMVDVATGLGMTKRQILFTVEVPYAIPMIMAGVKIAGIWTIGMGTLTSLVGSGGLGDLIMQGLRSMNVRYVLSGTIPAAILAIFFDLGMSSLEKRLKIGER